ncbi:hypothetical protein V6N13_006295 [Hibiscus sabdariffa]
MLRRRSMDLGCWLRAGSLVGRHGGSPLLLSWCLPPRNGVVGAGKFDVLANLEQDNAGGVGTKTPLALDNSVLAPTTAPLLATVESHFGGDVMDHGKVSVYDGEKRILLQGSGSAWKGFSVGEHVSVDGGEMASSEVVVPVRGSLDPNAHVDVYVVESGEELDSVADSGRRASAGIGLMNLKYNMRLQVGKGGARKGEQTRKKASGHASNKVQLGEWIGGLETELSDSGGEKIVSAPAGDILQKNSDANVYWRKNNAFLKKSDH